MPEDAQEQQNSHDLRSTLGGDTVRGLDWLALLVWGIVVLIGILQSRQIDAGWLTHYGGDVFGTAAFWWGLRRTVFARMRLGAELAAVSTLVACFAWEWCQRFDLSGTLLHITEGTFDPLDFIAYTLTVGACYTADRFLQRRRQQGGV